MKYKVDWSISVRCSCTTFVEADSEKEAIEKAKKLDRCEMDLCEEYEENDNDDFEARIIV